MDWISGLSELSVGIAFAVVLVAAVTIIMRTVMQHIVRPLEQAILRSMENLDKAVSNHLTSDLSERLEMRKVVQKSTEAIEQQCQLVRELLNDRKRE